MDDALPQAAFFVAGGTVPPGSLSYVARAADVELFDALREGVYCSVLNARQMGKSSLAVRTIHSLNEAGVTTAFVDLTRVGGANARAEQWYAGILIELGRSLGLRAEAATYLKGETAVGPGQRLFGFLHEVVLTRVESPIVVMIDEIDAVRSLPFSADEFFAGLRQLHNGRASDPALRRLTVCLLGAALPSDLVRDPRTTPYNVGRRVELRDFTPEEARPLGIALGPNGASRLARVLFWTGGHPYLTQALCADLALRPDQAVDALVRERYLVGRARETDTNLADVGNRLIGHGDPSVGEAERADALTLYGAMLQGRSVPDDEANPAAARIKMSGVARLENGRLAVRNAIYKRVFDTAWVRNSLPEPEVRRQRQAYRRGATRVGVVSFAVLAVVSALAAALAQSAAVTRVQRDKALKLELQARQEEATMTKLRGLAEDGRDQANRLRVAAYGSQRKAEISRDAATRLSTRLKSALEAQRRLSAQARAATRHAEASAALALVAGARERDATRRALEDGRKLDRELYAANMDLVGQAWERGDVAEMSDLARKATASLDRGPEAAYWKARADAVLFRVEDFEGLNLYATSNGRWLVYVAPFEFRVYDARSGRLAHRVSLDADMMVEPGTSIAQSYLKVGGDRIVWPLIGRLAVYDLAKGRRYDIATPTDIPSFDLAPDGRTVHLLPRDSIEGEKPFPGGFRSTEEGRVALDRSQSSDGATLAEIRNAEGEVTGLRELDRAGAPVGPAYAFQEPERALTQWFVTSEGRHVAALGRFGKLHLFDRGKGRVGVRNFEGVASVSADGHQALMLGGGKVRVVDLDIKEANIVLPARSAVLSPDGRRLYLIDRGLTAIDLQRFRPYLPATAAQRRRVDAAGDHLKPSTADPAGKRLATLSPDGRLEIKDIASGRRVSSRRVDVGRLAGRLPNVVWDGDGLLLVSNEVRRLDLKTGGLRTVAARGTDWITGVDLSPDGTRLLTSTDEGLVCLWSTDTGRRMLRLPPLAEEGGPPRVFMYQHYAGACFTPDGRAILVRSGIDHGVYVFGPATPSRS